MSRPLAVRVVSLALLALLGQVACQSGPGPTASPSPAVSPSPSPSASPSSTAPACGAPTITPAASEPNLTRAAMAYDKATKQVILIGDVNQKPDSQTWAWTPQTGWQQLAPATSPPGRTSANMAYDDATAQIVLWGGQTATPVNSILVPLTDTWTWDGTNWTQQHPATIPPPTVIMPLAYDAPTQTVIGVTDDDPAGNVATWQWDGTDWKHLQPTLAPKYPKQGAGLAYSTAFSMDVMFGTVFFTIPGPAPDAHTWTYSAANWADHPPAGSNPKPRMRPGMSAEQHGGVLMFGGAGSGFTVNGETWMWLGKWQQRIVSPSPKPRMTPLMAYDSTCELVVLYGGEFETGSSVVWFHDTWVWNSQAWTKVG
jgi:hypothetical protein